jgi:hypothetical protein
VETLIYIVNVGAWLNYCCAQISSTVSSNGLNQSARVAIIISALSFAWFLFNL